MSDLFSKFSGMESLYSSLQSGQGADPVGVVMEKMLSPTEAIINGKQCVLAGTYNYLGMTFNEEVLQAGIDALKNYGSGTTGSRLLNGTYASHIELEDLLKRYFGTEHAMAFSTGYQANLGVCSTLTQKGDYIIIDTDSHASIYDGCSMGSATMIRFRHNSIEDLRRKLQKLPSESGKLVVLEGVYSMLGDVAPVRELAKVAKEFGAMVMVDEAHSIGYLGEKGRGVVEAQGAEDLVDFIVGTFSKSVGTIGGFCVSSHPSFDILRIVSRPYMYTASQPPSVIECTKKSLDIIMNHSKDRIDQLWKTATRLHKELSGLGFTIATPAPESAIISVLVNDRDIAVKIWNNLLKHGVYVNLAVPPTTPRNMSLLRCSACASHTEQQVDMIIEAFTSVRPLYAQ